MAAEVTYTTLFADSVVGDIRVRKAIVTAAATLDFITLPVGATIFGVVANPPGAVDVIINIAANVATLVYTGGGAMTGVSVMLFFI